ncbi:STAS domain-containing protein [bacterium]|nr:STAS domain-containing protein [bacterium]
MTKEPNIILETEAGTIWMRIEEVEASLKISDKTQEKIIAILEEKPAKLAIDMHKVDFIDSAFLGVLISSFKEAKKQGTDIVLYNLRSNVRAIFSLTRLDTILPIFPDKQAVEEKWKIDDRPLS